MRPKIVEVQMSGAPGTAEAVRNVLDLFARVPSKRPLELEREMRKLNPTRFEIAEEDLPECFGTFQAIWADLQFDIEVYLQALAAAKSDPRAPALALSCLENRGALGFAGYCRWFREPVANLDEMSPEKWLQTKNFTPSQNYCP